MNIEIRDFVAEDLNYYLEMSADFFSSDAVMHPIPESYFRTTFDQCTQGNPYVRGLMVLVDGQYAGYSLLALTYSNEVGGMSVLLEEVYILPAFQGKGLGGKLFSFIEQEYIQSGKAKRLRLEVTKCNEGAIRLYQRQGFEQLDYVQMIKDVK